MSPSYLVPGLAISEATNNDPDIVRALQRDLRALGYLLHGIDGAFGEGTARAVRSLQIDLLTSDGIGKDGRAPIAVSAFNDDGSGGKRITAVTGVFDQSLAACLAAMMSDARVGKLPAASDPHAENLAARQAIMSTRSGIAPSPFIAAMMIQESGGQHFREPNSDDSDTFVTVGLDRNDAASPDKITSRGYGIGQDTLFHHPPSVTEVNDRIADPIRNVQHSYKELRDKFDHYVCGPADKASDRLSEHPQLPLRLCRYQPSDPRYLADCKACALAARKVNVVRGTPAYQGASISYQPDQYYPSAIYNNVPDRSDFLCDWPYAVRRYNGSGVNSFHYQTRILLNLLK